MNFTVSFSIHSLSYDRRVFFSSKIFCVSSFLLQFLCFIASAWALFLSVAVSVSFSFVSIVDLSFFCKFCFKRHNIAFVYTMCLLFDGFRLTGQKNRNALHIVRDMPFHSILSNAHLSIITEKSDFVCRFKSKRKKNVFLRSFTVSSNSVVASTVVESNSNSNK